eukprot:maker-scaffold1270_size51608-snap-gene-0.2 protein:Tk12468 transcript:maker-scaffold1270_size51608-snap-gene-0.2-mRNA-1 annotation:"hypothetical protein"
MDIIITISTMDWLVADGDIVKLDQPICEFESDKATLEFPAEAEGKITLVAAEDDDLEIGALVAKIDTSAAGEATPAPAPAKEEAPKEEAKPAPVAAAPATANYATGHPSPAAGKIMREGGVDPAGVTGTGKDGRITKADAESAVSNPSPAPAAQPAAPSAPSTSGPVAAFSRGTSTEKMSRMRRTIAKRLVSAKNNTAMLTTFNEVDLSEVMAMRKKYQEKFVEKHGVKLGFMSLFAKACSNVLMEMRDVNAQIAEDGASLIYHDFVDISIAISTPTGLVVPPVKNVESLGFHEIENEIKGLAKKARDGSLTLEEMKGGTFTITNGGVFGSLVSTPIINEPQSAILGMHTIKERPIAVNGEVVIRPMMWLALSYDHRVIDGSTSVTFLVK